MLENRQELVAYSSRVPIKIFIHKLGEVSRHWHRSLELLMVLEGDIDITVDSQTWHLKSDDILLINSSTMHSLSSAGAVLIAVQINPGKFTVDKASPENLHFDCNSQKRENPAGYAALKTLIATMLKQGAGDSDFSDYHNQALAYTFFATLLENFKTDRDETEQANHKQLERTQRILSYINENYRDNLTLNQVADAEGISVPYLSTFFKKKIGVNFSSYYSNVRLEHAVEDMLETNDTIESVALRNGYTEPHTFIRAFKKHYGTIPSAYRKSQNGSISETAGINYLSIEPGNYLNQLTRYLQQPGGQIQTTLPEVALQSGDTVQICPAVDYLSQGTLFGQAIHKFIGVGSAHELLRSDIQTMLADAQNTIGFEYVKFHGLLSDEMMVCSRVKGELNFSFVLVDQVIDYLLSIGLKPLIQLSFMPACLADQPDKRVYMDRFVTSLPKSLDEWMDLVRTTIGHLLSRYGRTQVRSWLFSVWNEPDISDQMFGVGDDEKFYQFYASTYHAVKEADSGLIFGAPSNLPIAQETRTWMNAFLDWTVRNDCPPQFLNIHYYADDFDGPAIDSSGSYSTVSTSSFKRDIDNFQNYIREVHKIRARTNLSGIPIYLTEFNLTVSHRNLLNDTCFIATWLARNVMLNADSLDSFGYWSLTDLIGEHPIEDELFHGGMGMFTKNGVRKPAFFFYQFAKRMIGERIALGDNYLIVRIDNGLRILCWNYEHFNNLFASGELFDMSSTNRYTLFNRQQKVQIRIPLKNLPSDSLKIREYYTNRSLGSAFDQWLAMGGQPLETRQEISWLKQSVRPGFRKSFSHANQGSLDFSASLEPHEVRLVEIDFC